MPLTSIISYKQETMLQTSFVTTSSEISLFSVANRFIIGQHIASSHTLGPHNFGATSIGQSLPSARNFPISTSRPQIEVVPHTFGATSLGQALQPATPFPISTSPPQNESTKPPAQRLRAHQPVNPYWYHNIFYSTSQQWLRPCPKQPSAPQPPPFFPFIIASPTLFQMGTTINDLTISPGCSPPTDTNSFFPLSFPQVCPNTELEPLPRCHLTFYLPPNLYLHTIPTHSTDHLSLPRISRPLMATSAPAHHTSLTSTI
ncbi:hypothetical protein Fcan01_19435 [Folsomia candida]|uniref:Uncharacterized protein n=1 Tax=Folsomia candida TaxID=158441 RepID=A0A226DKR6_FOLCA|nr:hypothetical protein Fcan01_19435 [Folsomia candida]